MKISIEQLPERLREFAKQEVVLTDGRRMSELDLAMIEAKEAAEVAEVRLTKDLVITVLGKNMLAQREEEETK